MKKTIALLLLISLTFGFTNRTTADKEFDKQLIGVWKGFEKDQQIDGMEKHWIMERSKDGTFLLMFTMAQDCQVQTSIEKGKWWTEKGKFYEWHEDGGKTDAYTYEVVDGPMVKFKSITLLGKESESYEFTDYKLE